MKLIKFDLPLNGAKVHNLEELRDNFTTEILELHDSGLLLKWLKNRNLMIEADKLSAIPADLDDADKLVALCEIFGVEAVRQVTEAVPSKEQSNQRAVVSEDPEEYEKPSESQKEEEAIRERLIASKYVISVAPEVIGIIVNDEYVCNTQTGASSTTVNLYVNSDLLKFLPNTHSNTTYIFNYTDMILYAKEKNNIPSRIDMMKDCIDFGKYGINNRSIDVISIQTIANPFNIVNMANSGEGDNYLDVLVKLAEYKNSKDPNNIEATAIFRYMCENVKQLSDIVKGVGSVNRLHNDYVKVLVAYRLHQYDLDISPDDTVYIENKDILISKRNFIDIPDHPYFDNKSMLLARHDTVHKGAAVAYLVGFIAFFWGKNRDRSCLHPLSLLVNMHL